MYFFKHIKLPEVRPLQSAIPALGLPLLLYDNMSQTCDSFQLDYFSNTLDLMRDREIKVKLLNQLGFRYVPGDDRVLMFNPELDINNSILNRLNLENIGHTAVYQHINNTDYAYEVSVSDKFNKKFVDMVSAWRVEESYRNLVEKDIHNLYARSEAILCLIDDVKQETHKNDEGYTKSLFNTVSQFYHKLDYNYTVNPETRALTGPMDASVKYVKFGDDGYNIRNIITIAEVKSPTGDSWYELLRQARRYCYSSYFEKSVFVIIMRGTKIAFFIHQPGFHEKHFYWALNNDEIQILPQKNTTYPQLYFYDFADNSDENVKGIHYIFEFQAQYTKCPIVKYNPNINKMEIIEGSKRNQGIASSLSSRNKAGFNFKVETKPSSNLDDKGRFTILKDATVVSKPYRSISQTGLNLQLDR